MFPSLHICFCRLYGIAATGHRGRFAPLFLAARTLRLRGAVCGRIRRRAFGVNGQFSLSQKERPHLCACGVSRSSVSVELLVRIREVGVAYSRPGTRPPLSTRRPAPVRRGCDGTAPIQVARRRAPRVRDRSVKQRVDRKGKPARRASHRGSRFRLPTCPSSFDEVVVDDGAEPERQVRQNVYARKHFEHR